MPTSPRTPGSPGPVWTVAAVARRLGVAPGTLRSWGQRYGIGPVGHSPGRHRRYTDADIAELDAMRALVDQGMVLSAAAAVVRSQRPGPAVSAGPEERSSHKTAQTWPPGPTPSHGGADLVAAATRLDHDTVGGIVRAGLAEHGVIATWEQLCRPALAGVDAEVADDRGCTDAQLLLSWVISACLRRSAAVSTSGAGPVLLACAAGEQHTLAMDALFAALTEHHVPARMLGPAVPAIALRHAAQQLRPAAVVVWAQREHTANPGVLHRLAHHTDVVLTAGPGWHRTDLPTTVIKVDDLRVALALLTHASKVAGMPLLR